MPYSQSIPITSLDEYGLIYDRPAPSLPTNAFSDGLNVRFRDGTIRKMQGELNIFPHLFDDATNLIGGIPANYDGSSIKYIAFWANPNVTAFNSGYYLLITEENRSGVIYDVAYLLSVDGSQKIEKGLFTPVTEGRWQHTLFQGGFALIINNGIDKPHYILDVDGNTDITAVPNFLELPGWDSYNLESISLTDRFDPPVPDEDGSIIGDSYIFSLGKKIDFDNFYIKVYRTNSRDPDTIVNLSPVGDDGTPGTANNPSYVPPAYSTISQTPYPASDLYEIFYDEDAGVTVLNLPLNLSQVGLDTITVKVISRDPTSVRARVIRAFGDLLVAGDLVERSEVDPFPVLRSLPGVIRTSDVAAPGAIPNNWNPFASGVSTADEYIVSDVAPVTDMAEMQGNMYIYTQTSISVLRRTGNPDQPIQISALTDSYGCLDTHCLIEFEGKHIVLGSKDVYLFSGNPAGIESVADGRIRRYLFNTLNPIGTNRVFMLDNKAREEIWICYPTVTSTTAYCDEAMVWSYTNNTWSRRELRGAVAGVVGPIPGGGLPGASVDFDGVSGDSGVTHVGAYEVRMMGTDPNLDLLSVTDPVYSGTPTQNFYVNGTTFAVYSTDVVAPILRVTGPEGLSTDVTLTLNGTFIIPAQSIWDDIQPAIEAHSGWSIATLPTDYVQKTGTVRIAAADTLRTVESTPFAVSVLSNGTFAPDLASFTFHESTVDANVQGEAINITNDYRGSPVLRASPTVLAMELINSEVTGGIEMLFATVGADGDYDPATHTGTVNGVTFSAEQTANTIVAKLGTMSSAFVVSEGVGGVVNITSAAYDVSAGVINQIRINVSTEDADWILERYNSAVAGSIYLNPNSDTIDPASFGVASNAPAIAGTLDTQHTPDGSRTPDRTDSQTPATVTITEDINNNFDLVRPWPKDEINPNLEYPILATKAFLDGVSGRPIMNKVVAADLGWSIPKFSQTPRVETDVLGIPVPIITENDEPLPYESYVERKQMNMSPDMDTESIHQMTIWASGSEIPYVGSETLYNRLQMRYKATDNPGKEVDLTTVSGNKKGDLFVSEGYKFDTRLHGRYLNFRITDEIMDENDIILEATANTKQLTGTTFTQKALWEISGLQPEVNKGGRR